MILLVNTADVLRVVSSSVANLACYAAYADHASGTITPGRQVTAISSAATTTIVSAPGASTQRTVRMLTIRNTHATTANTITLQLFDGTNAFAIYTLALAAGEALTYDEGSGFHYIGANGLPKIAQSINAQSVAVGDLQMSVLSSDVTTSPAVANTLEDVTGLSFGVTALDPFWFQFVVDYEVNGTATGSRWTINGPGFSKLSYAGEWALTATTRSDANSGGAYQLPAASGAGSGSITGNVAFLEGFITPTADGTVQLQFACELATTAFVRARAGSFVRYMRLT